MKTRGLASTVGAVAAAAVLLAGCGSSGSSKPAAAGATSAAGTATSAAGTATSAPAATTSPAAASGGSDSGSTFCQLAKSEEASLDAQSSQITTDTPDQLKAFEEKGLQALKAFEAAAPSSIKSAVQTLADADQKINDVLAQNGYSFTKAEAGLQSAISDPKIETASNQIGAYLKSACGIDTDASATPTS